MILENEMPLKVMSSTWHGLTLASSCNSLEYPHPQVFLRMSDKLANLRMTFEALEVILLALCLCSWWKSSRLGFRL
jgi:hypothetical protein